MKQYLKTLFGGIWAGIAISIGCICLLVIQNPVAGSVAFSVGLFIVLVNGFSLYTGMVSYIPNNPPSYLLSLLFALIGNFIGATAAGLSMRLTRISDISVRALSIVEAKASGGFLSMIILGIFCNLLIYFAVESFKNNKHEIGKYLGVMLCVPAFVVCGFEHCVANMCYMAVAACYTPAALFSLLMVIVGNTIGGVLIVLSKNLLGKK